MDKLPQVGESNAAAFSEKAKKTSSPLKQSSANITVITKDIMTRLNNLGSNESSTPDDIAFELNSIYRDMTLLPKVPLRMEKMYENAMFKSVFPILDSLYDE